MTFRVLEKEALELPPRTRVRLAERILESVDDFADPGLETAWATEIQRRVKEVRSGKARCISAEDAMARAVQVVNETDQLSSARRKRTR